MLIFSLIHNRQSPDELITICNFYSFSVYDIFRINLDLLSSIFNLIFLFESIIEIIINPKTIMSFLPWCNILFFVSSIFLLTIFKYDSNENKTNDFLESFLISIQILRCFFTVKYVKFMKKFVATFKNVLRKSFPIIVFFLIIWFFYSLLAYRMFCYLKPQKFANSADINFSNILYSMFSLARVATIEQWYLILADCTRMMQSNFVCQNIDNYEQFQIYGQNGCGSLWAYPFFYSYYLIILLIFNLLVGIIINLSANIRKCEESSVNIYQLKDITKLWSEYDIEGCGYINYKDFWTFSSRIALILGVKIEELRNIESKKKFLKLLNLPMYESIKEDNILCFKFQEVVLVLSKISVMIKFQITK